MTILTNLKVLLTGDVSDFQEKMEGAGSQMAGVASAMSRVAAVAATAVLASLVAIGVGAFNMAADMQAATAKIQGQLGSSAAEAAAYGDSIANIYGANFGTSIEDVGSKVAAVAMQMERLGYETSDFAEAATVNAIRLSDAYGVDVSESAAAAAALMGEFNLSQQQAFDLVTTGFQRGLNSSDDFLDSIGEYSSQFAGLGFDAAEFFSILETGQLSGVLGTDKIADSVKEWGIIMTTEADRAGAALGVLGMDFGDISAEVSSGESTWADYFGEIVTGLQDIEDPVLQQQTAIALFGTMAEDMGEGFLDGLDMMATGMADMEGATESLDAQYATLGSAMEGFKRQGEIALIPVGEVLLGLAEVILPKVQGAMASLSPFIEGVSGVFLSFFANLGEGMSPLDAFIEALWGVAPQGVLDALVFLRDDVLPTLLEAFGTFIQPILDVVAGFFEWQDVLIALGLVFLALVIPAIWSGVVALGALVLAALPFILAFAAIVAVIALVRNAWENDWGGIQEKTFAAIEFVKGVVLAGVEQVRAWWAENGEAIMAKAAEIWGMVSSHVMTGIETAKTLISEGLAAIRAWWAENGDGIMAKAAEIWSMVSNHVMTGIETAKTLVSEGLAAITAWWGENGDKVTATVLAIWDGIKTAYKTALAFVLALVATVLAAIGGDWELAGESWNTVVVEAWERLKTAFGNGLEILRGAASDAWPRIKQAFSDGIATIKTLFNSVDWGAIGTAIVDGISAGLSAAAGAIADAARAAAQAALDAAKGLLGIESPSKVFEMQVGYQMGAGMAVGLAGSAGLVDAAMSRMVAPLPGMASEAIQGTGAAVNNRSEVNNSRAFTYNNYGKAAADPRDWFAQQTRLAAVLG